MYTRMRFPSFVLFLSFGIFLGFAFEVLYFKMAESIIEKCLDLLWNFRMLYNFELATTWKHQLCVYLSLFFLLEVQRIVIFVTKYASLQSCCDGVQLHSDLLLLVSSIFFILYFSFLPPFYLFLKWSFLFNSFFDLFQVKPDLLFDSVENIFLLLLFFLYRKMKTLFYQFCHVGCFYHSRLIIWKFVSQSLLNAISYRFLAYGIKVFQTGSLTTLWSCILFIDLIFVEFNHFIVRQFVKFDNLAYSRFWFHYYIFVACDISKTTPIKLSLILNGDIIFVDKVVFNIRFLVAHTLLYLKRTWFYHNRQQTTVILDVHTLILWWNLISSSICLLQTVFECAPLIFIFFKFLSMRNCWLRTRRLLGIFCHQRCVVNLSLLVENLGAAVCLNEFPQNWIRMISAVVIVADTLHFIE